MSQRTASCDVARLFADMRARQNLPEFVPQTVLDGKTVGMDRQTEVNTLTKKATQIDAHVGRQIRLQRLLVGMTQDRLAELLGLTFQQVQKYEKGINRIGAGRLFELSEILGVPVGFFYEGIGTQPSDSAEHDAGIAEFLLTEEGIRLNQAFMRIRPPAVKRRIIELIGLLAEGSEQSDVEPQSPSVGP